MGLLCVRLRSLSFLCNKITAKLLVLFVAIFIIIKLCMWQWQSFSDIQRIVNVASTAKLALQTQIFSQANEPNVNGNYYTDTKYQPPEPIDIVYTWVDGTDETLWQQMAQYTNVTNLDKNRFENNNELLYSLRSVEKYAPWVRHIYIVTNGQIPPWLNLDNPKVSIVTHSEICPPELVDEVLPTFSSMSIEMMLHRIPNLSDRFIYFNDDVFLGKPLYLDDMRCERHGIYVVRAWDFPFCAETCEWTSIGNNVCEDGCNVAACNFDNGDCNPFPLEKLFANGTEIEDMKGAQPEHKPSKVIIFADSYTESLVHSHKVLTDRYGFKPRSTIAHMGHLIDRNVMYDIEQIFAKDVHNSLIHRFRHGRDSLQLSFFYFETLLNEKRNRTIEEIFDDFDVDKSGSWSEMEIRYYLVRFNRANVLKWRHVENFCTTIRNCMLDDESEIATVEIDEDSIVNETSHADKIHYNTADSTVKLGCSWNSSWDVIELSRGKVMNCSELTSQMKKRFGIVRKYKATAHPNPDNIYTFNGVVKELNNSKEIFDRLLDDGLKIFNCINNDINSKDPQYYESKEYKDVIALWQRFYLSYFPLPSEYELPAGQQNAYRYIDEYRAFELRDHKLKVVLVFGLGLSLLVILGFVYWHMWKEAEQQNIIFKTTNKRYKPLLKSDDMPENV